MLDIHVEGMELYNEETNEFIYTKSQDLTLEHSLVSISKWESKWEKSFLSTEDKTLEETIDYIRCMTITQNVSPTVYYSLNQQNLNKIDEYIKKKMTATTFSIDDNPRYNRKKIITSEEIYYWMIELGIPMECQRWHINRLLTLIRVCQEYNKDPKKVSTNDLISKYQHLNAQRKKQLKTRG